MTSPHCISSRSLVGSSPFHREMGNAPFQYTCGMQRRIPQYAISTYEFASRSYSAFHSSLNSLMHTTSSDPWHLIFTLRMVLWVPLATCCHSRICKSSGKSGSSSGTQESDDDQDDHEANEGSDLRSSRMSSRKSLNSRPPCDYRSVGLKGENYLGALYGSTWAGLFRKPSRRWGLRPAIIQLDILSIRRRYLHLAHILKDKLGY